MQWKDRIGRRLKLQDMHILLAAVEAGSMAKAAEHLAISQPVVSRSIASLEHTLGVRLLDRSRSGIVPTLYGRALLTHGLAAFNELKRGVNAIESAHLFAMLQDHVTRLENTVRWRWSTGDVVIWDNRGTQHKAIDDYGDQPRIVRRVTVDGPISVGIDGRHGKRRNSHAQVTAAA
jgi:hypothetical protein